jgi:hypothetical protein
MASGTEMVQGVLVLARITAADMPAFHTHSKIDGGVTSAQALVANRAALPHNTNVRDVRARHRWFESCHELQNERRTVGSSNRLIACRACVAYGYACLSGIALTRFTCINRSRPFIDTGHAAH